MDLIELADPHNIWVYTTHVIVGVTILTLAIISLSSKKGGRIHVYVGRLFVSLSVIAGITAILFLGDFGFVHNIFGTSVLAISIVTSSFLALKTSTKIVKSGEIVSLLLTLTVAIVLISRFVEFSTSDGLLSEAAFFTFSCAFFPLFFLVYDLCFLTRNKKQRRAMRLRRHVSGMAFVIAVMIHAPIVSVFTDVSVNFYVKFFSPYVLWPVIYFYYFSSKINKPHIVEEG